MPEERIFDFTAAQKVAKSPQGKRKPSVEGKNLNAAIDE
jgi:hypothetical protein